MTIKLKYQKYDDVFFPDDPVRTCVTFLDAHSVYADLDCFVISFSYRDGLHRLKHGRFTFECSGDVQRALDCIDYGLTLNLIDVFQCDICWDVDAKNEEALEKMDEYYFTRFL